MGALAMLAGTWCVLGAPGVLAFQIYHHLKYGSWMALSVLDILKGAGIEWAVRPTDWFGLHQSLDWVPLSAALFVLGAIVAWIGRGLEGARRNRGH